MILHSDGENRITVRASERLRDCERERQTLESCTTNRAPMSFPGDSTPESAGSTGRELCNFHANRVVRRAAKAHFDVPSDDRASARRRDAAKVSLTSWPVSLTDQCASVGSRMSAERVLLSSPNAEMTFPFGHRSIRDVPCILSRNKLSLTIKRRINAAFVMNRHHRHVKGKMRLRACDLKGEKKIPPLRR